VYNVHGPRAPGEVRATGLPPAKWAMQPAARRSGRRARLASRASSHALPQSRPQPPLNHCASMPTAEAMAVTCAMCARDVQMMDSTASWRWDWVRFWRFGAATLLAA